MAEDTIELKVRALPNATYDISTSLQVRLLHTLAALRRTSQTTVAGLKRILEEKTNTPQERQRLIYRGRVLDNNTTLAENALQNGHTIHMVERNPDNPELTDRPEATTENVGSQGTTTISVNVGSGVPAALNDIGRIVQGVLNAVGVRPNVPSAAAAPPAATNASPNDAPTSASKPPLLYSNVMQLSANTGSVEYVPHLLCSFGNYVSRMESGGLPTRILPLFSLTPPDQTQTITSEQLAPLTTALCQILSNATLDEELRAQLEAARQSLQSTGDAAVESTAVPGASVCLRTENNAIRVQRASNTSSSTSRTPPAQYSYLPLLIAAFGNVVERTEKLIRERASRSLNNAVRQFQSVTEIDESNLEILIGGLLQIGSVSHWYGALMAELGRLASAIIPALNGNLQPLALNTAAVITHEGSFPNFQPLLPRGLTDGGLHSTEARTHNANAPTSAPITGINVIPGGTVSVSLEQGTLMSADGQPFNGPVLEQVAVAVLEGQLPQEASSIVPSAPQNAASVPTQNPVPAPQTSPSNPPVTAPVASSSSQTTPSSENQGGAPAGLRSGLRARPKTQGTSSTQATTNASTRQQQSNDVPRSEPQIPSNSEGMGSLLSSVAQLIGNQSRNSTEGLGNLVGSLVNNPGFQRMVEDPGIQRMFGEMVDSNSQTPNISNFINQTGTLLNSVLGNANNSPAQTGASHRHVDTGSLTDLPAERVDVWNRIIQRDIETMNEMPEHPMPLSVIYLAGQAAQDTENQILRADASFEMEHDEE